MTSLSVLLFIQILCLGLPQYNLLSLFQYPIKHDLFQSTLKINQSLVYYKHRLIIGHIATLPCEYNNKNSNDEEYGNSINRSELVIYEWLFNGRQLLPHRAFFHANWDIYGVLTIWAMIARPSTIWCHKQVLHSNSHSYDYYYSHEIIFINLAVLQQIIGIKVDVEMDEKVLLVKCKQDNYTCDCQLKTSPGELIAGEEIDHPKHYILKDLEESCESLCEDTTFCTNFYLEDFLCMNKQSESKSTHYTELTFILDNVRRYSMESESFQLFDEFIKKFQSQMSKTKSNIKVHFTYSYRSIHYCMGPSGKLVPSHSECDLCQPGSYYPSRIVNPSPPAIDKEFHPFSADQPILTAQYSRSVFYPPWITDDDPTTCLPCPENTYSEEYGQSACLPCPFQHSIPTDPKIDIRPTGGNDWLHIACPKEGRSEIRMMQVIQGMLGETAGNYIKHATILKRVGIICCLLGLPGIISFLLMFTAFVLIDVGSTLIQMARNLHPLQIQIAETSTANTRFDADQRKAAEEVYKRMKNQ
ncbi:unnamed protein product [Heterobilharzia americana]|nr:unnamed protein product [Heterobilharzia americana]